MDPVLQGQIRLDTTQYEAALKAVTQAQVTAAKEAERAVKEAEKQKERAAKDAAKQAAAAAKELEKAQKAAAKEVEQAVKAAEKAKATAAKEAAREASAAAKTASQAQAKLINSTRSLLGGLGLTLGVAAVGTGLRAVTQDFLDLDKAMREVNTIARVSRAELRGLQAGVVDLSIATGQDAIRSTRAMYEALSSGVPAARAVEFVGHASRLAVAGVADLADTTKLLAATMNAFELGVDDMGKASDTFFAIVERGVVTVPELAQQLGDVFPTAHRLGISLEELGAMIALTTKRGISMAESATAINQALLSVMAPSREAANLSKALGIEFNAAAVRAQGLDGVLRQVVAAVGDNEEALNTLFGSVRGLKAVLTLLANDGAALDEEFRAITDSAGATDRALREMEGPSLRLSRAWQALKADARGLGGAIVELFDPLTAAYLRMREGDGFLTRFGAAWRGATKDLSAFELALTGVPTAIASAVMAASSGVEDLNRTATQLKDSPLVTSGKGISYFLGEPTPIINNTKALAHNLDTVEGLKAALKAGAVDVQEFMRRYKELTEVVEKGSRAKKQAAKSVPGMDFSTPSVIPGGPPPAGFEMFEAVNLGGPNALPAGPGGIEYGPGTAELQSLADRAVETANTVRDAMAGVFSSITGTVAYGINQVIWGTGKLEDVVMSLGQTVTGMLLDTLAQMAAQAIATSIIKSAAGGKVLASRMAQLSAETYAAAFAATAAIPIIGPLIAPGVAGGAVATMHAGSVAATAAGQAAGASMGAATLPSFDIGGIVPGPIGAPMVATVHGGESILNQRQQAKLIQSMAEGRMAMGGGQPISISIQYNGGSREDSEYLGEIIVRKIEEIQRRGGRGRSAVTEMGRTQTPRRRS